MLCCSAGQLECSYPSKIIIFHIIFISFWSVSSCEQKNHSFSICRCELISSENILKGKGKFQPTLCSATLITYRFQSNLITYSCCLIFHTCCPRFPQHVTHLYHGCTTNQKILRVGWDIQLVCVTLTAMVPVVCCFCRLALNCQEQVGRAWKGSPEQRRTCSWYYKQKATNNIYWWLFWALSYFKCINKLLYL